MGERYMTLEEWLRDEKEEGRREGKRELIFEFLKEFGTIPKELEEKINGLEDEEGLKLLVKKAAKADSLESFEKEAGQLFLS